ncbi:MAG: hypothetical protein PHT41_02530 [Candidatus Omnitrophica bacterium]|nr:hypothetical protein [Candidatus Omnitrophota bacterium]MDD5238014.1 hypothetical protein [Candidatus Omnitrophota bacterium]
MIAKNNKWVKASVFVEYSLIIGAVALALAGMDYYIRRGIMSRTKDITDYMISPDGAARQENDSSPGREITSDSSTESGGAVNTHMYTGGGTGIETDSWQSTTASSNVIDRQTLDALPLPFDLSTFIPWQGTAFDDNEVSRERYEQYQDGDHVSDVLGYDWENDDDPCRLGAEVGRLREKADTLDSDAERTEGTNNNLITENNNLANNPAVQLIQAILDVLGGLRGQETELTNSTEDMRRQAQELRDRADAIEQKLETLPPCQG